MNAYIKVVILAVAVAAGFAAGHHVASQAGAVKLAAFTEQNAKDAQHVAELTAKAEQSARAAEHASADQIASIDAIHQREMSDAQAAADRTIADLRAGNLRLRAEWSCTSVLAADVAKAAAGAGQPDAAADLRATGASHLVRNADEADSTIRALQATVKADRALLDGPAH